MPVHLGLDAALGPFLLASPWLFNFAGRDMKKPERGTSHKSRVIDLRNAPLSSFGPA